MRSREFLSEFEHFATGDSPRIAPRHRCAPPKVPRRVPHVLQQWKALVLRIVKASTQHGNRTVQRSHPPCIKAWRLRDIERLAIQQWVADNFGKASDAGRMERTVASSISKVGIGGTARLKPGGGVLQMGLKSPSRWLVSVLPWASRTFCCWSALTRRLSLHSGEIVPKVFPRSGPFVRCVRAGIGAPVVNRVDAGSRGFKSGARNQHYLEFAWAAA